MESVRTVKVTVEIDTNKRTVRHEYKSLTEAMEHAEEDFGDLADHLVEDCGCDDDDE